MKAQVIVAFQINTISFSYVISLKLTWSHVLQQGIAGYKGRIPVAVKTLTSRDPSVISKFMEEADLMRKFVHANIVSLLGKDNNCKNYSFEHKI